MYHANRLTQASMKTYACEYLRRNLLQPCSFIQKQNQRPPYQTVSHCYRYLLHTSILNRIPRRWPRKLPTNLSLWTATSWRGRVCCTAVTQTKSRDWCWTRLFFASRYEDFPNFYRPNFFQRKEETLGETNKNRIMNGLFTITAEILVHSLANFYN